ncbi:MAG: GNAT family N-acetyltransferase [Verrucomicrobia bacterium]|nr:GNAT family N-acetyltransferase [Verrucomicrobiota bacterium]
MNRSTDAERLEIIAPDKRRHADGIIDLCAKVFSTSHTYFEMLRDVGYHVTVQSYDWRVSRIGLLDGRIVSHWGVVGYTMRIGGARVRVGGVTCVATHADYRKHGLMPPTGRASIAAMRAAGYDMTVLFGVDDYYDRYGYVNAWPYENHLVRRADLPVDGRSPAVHTFQPYYLDELTKMANRYYGRCTGTAVRVRFPDPHGEANLNWECLTWLGARRRPAGYVVVDPNGPRLTCHEHAGDPDEVLRVLAERARRAEQREIRFLTLHCATPLAARLRRMNCRVETDYRRCGGPMIGTLNLRSTLTKIVPELARRLRRSPLVGWRGPLLVADAREKVTLVINRGAVRVAPPARTRHLIRGGDAIARLLLGSDEPDEVIEGGGIRTTGDARMLARVLFPNERPNLCNLDHY